MSNTSRKTTAQSTTEQPEAKKRQRPRTGKRKDHSSRRMREQQKLEQMKRQYNTAGSTEFEELEKELT